MKRILPRLLAGIWAIACSALATSDPPPLEWTGWQVRVPSGEAPVLVESGDPLGLEPLSSGAMADVLSMPPANEPRGPVTLDFGLQPTLPVSTSSMIPEIARCLDYNWLFCYLFVRDNIRFTPYRGLARGPERTLIDREGNDADQASLLFALLRASGYPSSTICYSPTNTFRVRLASGQNDYDAAHWLGIPADGTVSDLTNAIHSVLSASGVPFGFSLGASPQQSRLIVEHFCVWLNDGYSSYYIDPSFKPRRRTPPEAALLADAGYARSNLLACVGGTVSNAWFAQGLSTAGLTNELVRLALNLAAAWRAKDAEGGVGCFVGRDDIVPHNFETDGFLFHGEMWSFYPFDFLSQATDFKNSLRARLLAVLGNIQKEIFLDEISDRTLWISFTNAPGYAYPRAVLRMGDSLIAEEAAGASTSTCPSVIGIVHPSLGGMVAAAYSLTRAVTNVYVMPVGFGSDAAEGMHQWAARDLSRLQSSGLGDGDTRLRAAVLQGLGQQWFYQCAQLLSIYASLAGHAYHGLFETGIVGHEGASFFDFKTGCDYTSAAEVTALYGGRIFTSALEHEVLDQANGIQRPAVSAVRAIALANGDGIPVYLASSSNWETVRSALTGYGPGLLGLLDADLARGQKVLLPGSGQLELGRWTGTGFFQYGPKGTGSLLAGGLNGGFTTEYGFTLTESVLRGQLRTFYPRADVQRMVSADPVDMRAGAAMIDRVDAELAGPARLVWKRHYDSRQRGHVAVNGRGWSHGYDGRVLAHADPEAFMGRGAPAASAVSAVACAVVNDLLSADESARNLTLACLVADWWAGQLLSSGTTVTMGGEALSFTRMPDGTYEPVPGVTASLSKNTGDEFVLRERHGRAWTFAPNGLLSQVEDPSGNRVNLVYEGLTNLVAVTNTFGTRLDLSWQDGRISGVTDSAGRSVGYVYTPDGCLTGVTDAAGERWRLSYDAEGALLSETSPSGAVMIRNAFNTLGQVTNQLSASGQSWQFAYSAGWRSWEADPFLNRVNHGFTWEGRPGWRADRDGAFHERAYDNRGHIVTNTDALGRLTVGRFDASNRLTSVTEAYGTSDARTAAFAYDALHRLAAITNALGHVTTFAYDAQHRLVLTTLPGGVSVTNVYDSHGLPTQTRVRDAGGHVLRETARVFDERGLPIEASSTDAGATRFSYDLAGQVTNILDALGRSSALAYDARGLLTATSDAVGQTTMRLYTPDGRLGAVVDPLGRTNRFLWTPGGKLSAVIRPDGSITTNAYDIADRLATFTDPRGTRIDFERDVVGRVTRRHTPRWEERTWYDIVGCVTSVLDAASVWTDFGYDWLDRPVLATDGLGCDWWTAFDALDRVTGSTDPRGRSRQYAYDPLGRRTAAVRPSGATDAFGYDGLGNWTIYTNAEGRVYTMAYDAMGRILTATNALGQQVFVNAYDPVGNLTNRTDGAGNTVHYAYDELNRLVKRESGVGNRESAFGYDAVGNLLAASNVTATLAFSYDVMDRLAASTTTVSGVSFVASYARDMGGLVTNVVFGRAGATTPPSITRTHDPDGRLASVSDWLGHTWTFAWDGAGKPTGGSSPCGNLSANHYDVAGRLSSWSVGTLAGRTITRDLAGLKTREDITAGPHPMPSLVRYAENTFDAADRLTFASVRYGSHTNAAIDETYQYDGNGALTNVFTTTEGTNHTEVFASAYDSLGQLSSLRLCASARDLSYDPLGNRVVSGDRLWIPDHADPLKRPLIEADAATGVPIRYYLWSPGRLLGFIDAASGALTVAHCDEYGSVVALTDASGNTLHTACYGPNGQDWGATGTNPTPFAWLGGHGVQRVAVSDHLGPLYLTRYRLYAASLQRFLSPDPLGLAGGLNLYAYAEGAPLSYIDPLGLCAEGMWYDRLSAWTGDKVSTAKDYYANTLPWMISGTLNTAIDIVSGPAHMPSAIGHLGEGTGRFSADPSWENAPGMLMDVSTAAGVMAATFSALPSGRVPIGVNNTANPVPSSVARVVPGDTTPVTLGRTGAADVFVTAADDIAGMNAAQIQQRLAIKPSSSYTVIEFPTPSSGLASPINRSDPGFVGGGRTAGGAREFVLPNGPLPPGATIRRVP